MRAPGTAGPRTGGRLRCGCGSAGLTAPLSKNAGACFADKPSGRSLHPAVARTMLATDPPEHSGPRRLVTKAFTSAVVDGLRPRNRSLAEQLVGRWSAAGSPVPRSA